MLRFGKLPKRIDKRTIQLKSILKTEELPELPESYDIDSALGGIDDDRMFNNDTLGCCVIAAQAHDIFRKEKSEIGAQPEITDEAVKAEYLNQTGGLDTGLVMLDSLKKWRKGWQINEMLHKIYAFAEVDRLDHNDVKYCIYLLNGCEFGMMLYQTDINQFKAGEIWDLTDNDGMFRDGHGVYTYRYNVADKQVIKKKQGKQLVSKVLGYTKDGLWCMTWAKRQFMTWDFWDKRIDEAYGIVDDKDSADSALDVDKLQHYLDLIAEGGNPNEESSCWVAKLYVGFGNGIAKHILHCDTRLPAPVRLRKHK